MSKKCYNSAMMDHDSVIRRQFNNDQEAYKRFMQTEINERKAALLSSLEIVDGKTKAVKDAVRVTQSMLTGLKKDEKEIDKLFNHFKEMVLQIADWDHAHADHYNENLRAERAKYTNIKTSVVTTITDVEGKLAEYETERGQGHGAHGGAPVMHDADNDDEQGATIAASAFKQVLKPDKLSCTASPSNLEDWERQFKAFFAASMAQKAPISVQQEIFLKFLDPTLCKRIKRSLEMDTTIVANELDGEEATALYILRQEFKAIHPSLTRQLSLFEMKQAKGQKWTDFFHTWEDAFFNADLEGITAKQLAVILLVAGTSDTDLLEEFQKKSSSCRRELLAMATVYEANNKDRDFIASAKNGASANVATAGRGKPIQKVNVFFQTLKKEGRCYRCLEKLSEGHTSRCAGKTAKCDACKRTGHLTNACSSKNPGVGASAFAASASGGEGSG